ncbi:DUF4097 family beta strand repeat-containing protein [Streptomyces sp. SID13031]|uniref:DUF4097 family beta strand repeat-containing protein n=1 Tax=Streptomyces sp. SID13031 TaxID=2706046 RepID=UPI0013C7C664|nr:DUF4097 family beta strand repeat-containing protein [Streptomyces sp. SID13031]NEA36090.1 DUF4097 family beta strand repeat protein [Streptomyces sp. SID13031]
MRRGYAVAVDGPITIDAGLFAQAGWVKVQVRDDCTRAMVGVSTTDDEGPSAAAVQAAIVEPGPAGELLITVHGRNGATPVEITVVAPPGSILKARTDSASIGAIGLAEVELISKSGDVFVPEAGRVFAETTSGKVTVRQAADITVTSQSGAISVGTGQRVAVRTESGGIFVGASSGEVTAKSISGHLTIRDFQGGSIRADTTSGAIAIHATANGTVRAGTVSGAITITAAPGVSLDLKTSTATGQVTAP